jgi:aminoglycoside 6'-N-acetyltransferase
MSGDRDLIPAPPVLVTAHLRLRPTRDEDIKPLSAALTDPAVARFWSGYDEARTRAELIGPQSDTQVWAIELASGAPSDGGPVIGAVQASEEADPEYRHAGIDLFLAAAHQARGLGPEAIRAVATYLFTNRGHHRIVIDPAADNANAIKAYLAVGFRRIGVMRQYQRGPDGAYHDGLLLELIKSEWS